MLDSNVIREQFNTSKKRGIAAPMLLFWVDGANMQEGGMCDAASKVVDAA
jgi:hypothetical protein